MEISATIRTSRSWRRKLAWAADVSLRCTACWDSCRLCWKGCWDTSYFKIACCKPITCVRAIFVHFIKLNRNGSSSQIHWIFFMQYCNITTHEHIESFYQCLDSEYGCDSLRAYHYYYVIYWSIFYISVIGWIHFPIIASTLQWNCLVNKVIQFIQ